MDAKKLNYFLGFLVLGLVVVLLVNSFSTNKLGIAQKASKFTDVEVTNELSVGGAATLTGAVTTAGDVVVDDDNTTSTVAVGNTGVGKLCLWNGTQFSVLSFAAGSTSTSISTSTSCN